MKVLWLGPAKPANISVGRGRIVHHLNERGLAVTYRQTTTGAVLQSILEAGSGKYDLIVGTTRAGAIAGALLALVTGTRLVVDHVDPIRQLEETDSPALAAVVRRLENRCFSMADHVLYVYEEERARIERHADHITRTDLGVEFEMFSDPSDEVVDGTKNLLADLDISSNVAIYVGGLEPIYHIHELVAAMEHLDDWTLVVLGTGSLEGFVASVAEASDRIVFPGVVPHEVVPGYLHAADVGVCLVDDPNTLKILEYQAAGLPAVQLRGRAQDRFTQDLVEFCDSNPPSIADAIVRAGGRTDANDLQSTASRYDWEEIAGTYADVFASLDVT